MNLVKIDNFIISLYIATILALSWGIPVSIIYKNKANLDKVL